MADGIRATIAFPSPGPCPVAEVTAAAGTTVDRVWHSVPPGDTPTVTEFMVEGESPPALDGGTHLLSLADSHLVRVVHDDEATCACESLGEAGCAVQRYVARAGTVELVFNTAGYEELQAVVELLRERFPDLDVRRLVRSPGSDAVVDGVFVDRGKLTDRQLEVLRTAYERGYFERPRRANATELAEALDIAPSTLTEHLVTAQRKLLADVLEDGQ